MDGFKYARILPIVQSSGMGKSTMVDELSKTHFVIPINLRNPGGSGMFWKVETMCMLTVWQVILPLTDRCMNIGPSVSSVSGTKIWLSSEYMRS